jgi:hypothetical protein
LTGTTLQRGGKSDEHALCSYSSFGHYLGHRLFDDRDSGSRQRGWGVRRRTHCRRPTPPWVCPPDHGHDRGPDRSRARSSCQREPCRRGCDTAHSGRRAGTASRPAHTKSAGDGAEPVVGEAASGSLRYTRWRRCGCRPRSCDGGCGGSFRRVLRRRGCGRCGLDWS